MLFRDSLHGLVMSITSSTIIRAAAGGVVEPGRRAAQPLAESAARFKELPETSQKFVIETVASPADLADDGWKSSFVKAVTVEVRGDPDRANSFGMNTAGPRQIASLHDKILGTRILDQCRWQKTSNDDVKRKLSALVKLRGSIVHSGVASGLSLTGAKQYRDFVGRLATASDVALDAWLKTQTDRSSLARSR